VGSPEMAAPAAPTASYTTDPFPHFVLQFAMPPAGLSVIVERQDGQTDNWIRIAGPMMATSAVDSKVPASGPANYRISYVAADGKVGPASASVAVAAR